MVDATPDATLAILGAVRHYCNEESFVSDGLTYWADNLEVLDGEKVVVFDLEVAYAHEYTGLAGARLKQIKSDTQVASRRIIFWIERGLVLVESEYFRDGDELNKERFVELLNKMFSRIGQMAGLEIGLENLYTEVSKERVLAAFFEEKAILAKVDNLSNQTFPTTFNAFNPNFDKNQALRDAIAESTKDGMIDSITIQSANDGAPVSGAPLAKGIVGAGDIQEVVYRDADDPNGPHRRLAVRGRKKVTLSFALDGDNLTTEDADALLSQVRDQLAADGVEVLDSYTSKGQDSLFE